MRGTGDLAVALGDGQHRVATVTAGAWLSISVGCLVVGHAGAIAGGRVTDTAIRAVTVLLRA